MEQSEFIQKVISICNKQPNTRQYSEISTLVELTKTCKFFKSLIEENGNSSHIHCCKYLQYQFGRQGEYIFKYGEKGTKFYIIISGLVSVEIPKKTLKGDTVFFEAITLSSGTSFGELALESSKPRAASIRCKQDTHFMFLEKQSYVQLISKIVLDKRNTSVNFLQSLPIFNSCTKGTLTKLTYAFKEKYYNKGQIVYSEGDKAKEIFVVKKGEFEFFKIIKKMRRSSITFGIQPKDKFKHCKIANYCVGELFGEEDSINNQPRTNTCKSLTNGGIVLAILKDVIEI